MPAGNDHFYKFRTCGRKIWFKNSPPKCREELSRYVVQPVPSDNMRDGVYRNIRDTDLKQPKRMVKWHASQLAEARPAMGNTLADLALCLAAAEYVNAMPASQVQKSRSAIFVGLVSKKTLGHMSWSHSRRRQEDQGGDGLGQFVAGRGCGLFLRVTVRGQGCHSAVGRPDSR